MSSPKEEPSSKLNLFRFASKHKSSTNTHQKTDRSLSSGAQDPLSASSATATATASESANNNETLRIDTAEGDDAYPPESLINSQEELAMMSPIETQSESSLIFERSVEDPIQVYQPTQCPRCGKKNSVSGTKCTHQSIVNLPSHYSVENFVSPCLDATTKILTDENADLENVDMVYSRRPSSVMGLNMALGRTRSSVASESFSTSPPQVQKTHSLANMRDLDASSPTQRPPTLSFYSYADMINSENPNPRRPSISQSLSSSFLNRSNSVSMAASAITPQRTPHNARPSFSSPFTQRPFQPRTNSISRTSTGNNNPLGPPLSQKKFSLDTSPNSSDSESDYVHTRKNSINSRTSRASRKSVSQNAANSRVLNRSTSNQSSLLNSPLTPARRFSNLDDACFDASDNESLVVNSIGETLRRNTGEIQSSNNSIIA